MIEEILQYLSVVESERRARAADSALAARVTGLKRYQQRRFESTYGDLLASERYARAARFFLDELYGPGEFAQRDAQFARIVPKLSGVMPADVVSTVRDLAELHAVSELLDSSMARVLTSASLGRETYLRAWQRVGQRDRRELQLKLVLSVGRAIDGFSQRVWILAALRMMRGPAHAAGLASLQSFLEAGMSSFRSMHGAADFLRTVESRESRLMDALFAAGTDSSSDSLRDLPMLA